MPTSTCLFWCKLLQVKLIHDDYWELPSNALFYHLEKKPDIVYMKPKDKNNTIIEDAPSDAFLIGNIVVADSTGACILMLPNESVSNS